MGTYVSLCTLIPAELIRYAAWMGLSLSQAVSFQTRRAMQRHSIRMEVPGINMSMHLGIDGECFGWFYV
jgi:hypothetical protein